MKILISVLALFLNSNLLVPIRAQDGPRLQGETNSYGFFTSATCMSMCPENKPDSTGVCDTIVVGDCACVYDDDNYCSMGCDTSGWNMMCERMQPNGPRLQGRGETNGSEFFTSDACMLMCPENKPDYAGGCDTTEVGDCACVYDDDNYCSMGCDTSVWNTMCQSIMQPNGPRLQGCETNGSEFCTSDTCMSMCPENKPDSTGGCDTIVVGDCVCVYDDDNTCSMECDTSGWNTLCQDIMQPPIDNSDGIDVTTDEGDQETQTTDSDADTDNDTRDETMQNSNINEDGDISAASTADSSSRTNFNPHFSVVVSSIAAVVILGILL